MNLTFKTISIVCFLVFPTFVKAQFSVIDLNQLQGTPQQFASNLVGSGVQILNVRHQSNAAQIGAFNGTTGTGFSNGIILSTGSVNSANQANISSSTTTIYNGAGDVDINALISYSTYDAAILEIDFIPFADTLVLNYVFASEEYPEFASTIYADFLGIFVSGAGMSKQNIALVPGTTLPITVNTINMNTNPSYYVTNSPAINNNITYDAYTTPLTARVVLTPNQVYTLKIVIADGGDRSYDSAVLLEGESVSVLGNVTNELVALAVTYNGTQEVQEGCADGRFVFTMADTLASDTTIYYTIGGTAQNGIDYQMIADSVVIPAGESLSSVYITAIDDGINEGQEDVFIVFQTGINAFDTLNMFINDADTLYPILFTDTTICIAKPLTNMYLNGGSSVNTYTWKLPTGGGTVYSNNSSTTISTASPSITYAIQTTPKGCSRIDTVTVALNLLPNPVITCQAISFDSILVTWTSSNAAVTQSEININNTGWVATNNGILGHNIGGLTAGSTVNIKVRCYNFCTGNTPIIATSTCNSLNCTFAATNTVTPINCKGNCDGTMTTTPSGGTSPYTYAWANGQTTSTGLNLCEGWNDVTITDANGCFVIDSAFFQSPDSLSVNLSTTSTLQGTNNGSALPNVTGGISPYTLAWSGGSSNNLAAGSYTLTVTDANNCVLIVPFTISGYTCNLTGAATVTNVSCNGANDGSAVYNITNGNGNYTYVWSNGDTSSSITNLDGGNYSLVITDIFNCTFLDTIIINEPDTIETTFVIISDTSSMGVGSAIPTITGGTAPYTLTWSNGTSTNLTQGVYFLTVTDNNNCSDVFSFFIDDVNCSITGSGIVTDISCYDEQDGSINFTVSGGNGTVSYLWSNGDTTALINNLVAGNYTVTVADTSNCTFTTSFNIVKPDSISAQFIITNDSLNLGIGSVISVLSGGTQPYNLTWTGGTPLNLTQGTYFLTVTDDNNCENIFSFYIDNIVGTRQLLTENQIEIYPNPADDFVNIRLNLDKNYPIQVKIFSTDGRLMLHQNAASSLSNNLKISTTDLPKGIYVLQLIINNQFITKRLIIQ